MATNLFFSKTNNKETKRLKFLSLSGIFVYCLRFDSYLLQHWNSITNYEEEKNAAFHAAAVHREERREYFSISIIRVQSVFHLPSVDRLALATSALSHCCCCKHEAFLLGHHSPFSLQHPFRTASVSPVETWRWGWWSWWCWRVNQPVHPHSLRSKSLGWRIYDVHQAILFSSGLDGFDALRGHRAPNLHRATACGSCGLYFRDVNPNLY